MSNASYSDLGLAFRSYTDHDPRKSSQVAAWTELARGAAIIHRALAQAGLSIECIDVWRTTRVDADSRGCGYWHVAVHFRPGVGEELVSASTPEIAAVEMNLKVQRRSAGERPDESAARHRREDDHDRPSVFMRDHERGLSDITTTIDTYWLVDGEVKHRRHQSRS